MSNEHDELDDLEPLEPLDDLEPADADPKKDGDADTPAAAGAAAAAAAGAVSEVRKREIGEKRELEEAPLKLRTAAKILLLGAIFPFYSGIQYALQSGGQLFHEWDKELGGYPWLLMLGSKAVAGLGCWLFHEGYQATHGGKHKSPVASFAKLHPMVVPIIASVVWVAAVAWLFVASGAKYHEVNQADGEIVYSFLSNTGLIAEVLTMVLAGATISHIFGYEHGGKFNPIFPLMFLGPAIAGVLQLIAVAGVFSSPDKGIGILGLIGSITVAAGGIMAMKTMFDSMKEAKVAGEERQAAIRAARKAEREAKRAERGGGQG